jgi:SAM-dependent methyltransferase
MFAMMNESTFWDRAARRYAASPIKDMSGYERTIEETRRWLRPTDQVLEIGCGTGMTALRLAPSVARIRGTDVSPKMIEIARERAGAATPVNAHFAVSSAGDVAEHPAFDVVLAFNLLHLARDLPALLLQVRRALKPGGLFISKTPCLAEMNPLIRLAVPAMQLIGQAPHAAFFKADALERAVAAAGLQPLERARHGALAKDPRIFIVARKPDND